MIYLARHGETTWNLAGRYQGRLESALSALGVRQG
ncbi:MAG: histidine phosphatase family protein, partial [Vulcanimicrobiaceae bacterium]